MVKKTDLRVQKTQLLIRNAFLELIDEKGFTSMTVQNIADKAMIGRGTFYLHYKDKYDLMDQLIEFNLNKLAEIIQPSFHFSENKLNVGELRKMLIW
ncbi:MAG: TetR/AcrR family transcriptional regulator, partial [Exiguobacterium undae]